MRILELLIASFLLRAATSVQTRWGDGRLSLSHAGQSCVGLGIPALQS